MAVLYSYPIKSTPANRDDLVVISDSRDGNKTKQIAVANLPGSASFSGIGGSGTVGYIPKFSTSTDLVNSLIYESSGTSVGIGTTTPSSKLTILDSVDRDMSGTGAGQFQVGGNGYTFAIAMGATTTALYHNSNQRSLTLGTNELSRLTILGDGNIGIGTTNPLVALQVNNTSPKVRFLDTSDFFYTEYGRDGIDAYSNTNSTAPIFFKTGGLERMRIDASGNVGIGTTAPTEKLEVAGKVKITGTANFIDTTRNASSQANYIRFYDSSTSSVEAHVGFTSNNRDFKIDSANGSGTLTLKAGGGTAIHVNSSQLVGIGTTAPDSILTVKAATANVGIPVIKSSVNGFANGFTLIGDNYVAGESQFNLGISYSGANGVLSRGVKVSNTTDDIFLSSQDAYSTNPNAFILDRDGSFRFLNTSTNAATPVGTAVSLSERMRIASDGKVGIATTAPVTQFTVGVENSGVTTRPDSASTGFESLVVGTITFPAAAGYYRVAQYPTAVPGVSEPRGGARLDLLLTGGLFSPNTYSIDFFKFYTQSGTNHTLKLAQYGVSAFITKARLAVQSNITYLEIYKAATSSGGNPADMPTRIKFNRLHQNNGGSTPLYGTAASGAGSTSLVEVSFIPKGTSVEALRVEGAKVNLSNLPTSASGLAAGDIYNDGGTLKIVS